MVWAYGFFFWYLIRHKWYVLQACLALNVPFWQAIVHDLSKLRPTEFFPYAEFFYVYGSNTDRWGREPLHVVPGFARRIEQAKQLHQTTNKHHWNYWLLPSDGQGQPGQPGLSGQTEQPVQACPMPERYVREMVADWTGAGRAQGCTNTARWYHHNKQAMLLHPTTRLLVERVLREAQTKGVIPAEPKV